MDDLKREKYNAYMRGWKAKNAEKHRVWSRQWKKNNPERAKILDKKSRQLHPQAGRKAAKKWRDANPGKRLQIYQAWRAKNPGYDREYYERQFANNPSRRLFISCKSRAKRLSIPFNIEEADISVPAACPVLGIPLHLGGVSRKTNSPSVDRMMPHLGYVKGNVRVISWRANALKSNATIEELRAVLRYMEEHLGDGTTQNSTP